MSLSFEQVTFSYDVFPALKDVSFSLETGQIVGLIGENGAGKSTLELLRTQKQILLLVVALLLISCIVYRGNLFNKPFLELIVMSYCATIAVIILYQILAKKQKPLWTNDF